MVRRRKRQNHYRIALYILYRESLMRYTVRCDDGFGVVRRCGVCEQVQWELRRASDLLATTEVVRLEHKAGK